MSKTSPVDLEKCSAASTTTPTPELPASTSTQQDQLAAQPTDDDEFHSEMDQELESAVEDLLSFRGSEHLLRAAPLGVLMKGMGRIFASSKGTEATYELSAMTGRIRYFVSHNWPVPRIVKFVALAFKFNLRDAYLAAFATMGLCLFTGLMGWQPTAPLDGYAYETEIGCRLLVPSAVLFALVFGQAFHCCGSGPKVFLDKVCIHQVDRSLQSLGIRKLGAFIRASDHMLVLYTSLYCRRLWTVYEVASFLTLHDVTQLELVPIMLPMAFFLTLGGQVWYNLVLIGVQVLGLPGISENLCTIVGCLTYYIALRLWAKSRAEIRKTLQNFSVYEAACAVESDRQVVQTNIIALMKASKRVSRNTSDAGALEAFNTLVRKEMAEQFDKIFGKFAFSPSEYILAAICAFGPFYVDCMSWLAKGASLQEVMAFHALDLFYTFSCLPCLFLATENITSHFLHINWWQEILLCFATNVGIAVGPGVGRYLANAACKRAETEDIVLVALWIFQVLSAAVTIWFLPKVCSQHRRHSGRPVSPAPLLAGRTSFSSVDSLELGSFSCAGKVGPTQDPQPALESPPWLQSKEKKLEIEDDAYFGAGDGYTDDATVQVAMV